MNPEARISDSGGPWRNRCLAKSGCGPKIERVPQKESTMAQRTQDLTEEGSSLDSSGAQSPLEPAPPEVKPVPKVAGGPRSAIAAARFAFGEMGPIRATRTLLQLNQKQGIDCPGCAWPEPDGERSHFEFCEEGAKHVADEATSKRVTPEFFAKWSVKDLSEQSDLWLNAQGRLA